MNMEALSGLFGISALVMLFYGPWQSVCVDAFRQYAFEQRDILFDRAVKGDFEFNDAQYLKARSNIEASIRFADRATFARVIFLWYFCKELRSATATQFPEPFATSVGNVRRAMLISMYLRSGPLVILLAFASPLAVVSALYLYALKRSLRAVYDRIRVYVSVAESFWLIDSVASKAEIEAQCV